MDESDVKLIGIIAVLIVGGINIIVTIRQHRKGAFLTAITNERIRYITSLRKDIAEFCAKIDCNNRTDQEVKQLANHIILSLDPSCKEWDEKIIELVENILAAQDEKDKQIKIKDLLIICQFNFKIEWAGVQMEAKKGILSDCKKRLLRSRIYNEYQNYIKKKGQP